MHILLFIIYGVALAFGITRISFFRNSGIRPSVLIGFFGLRVGMGCLHNLIAWRYYPRQGDIWLFFRNSFVTRRELHQGFGAFWADNGRLADLPHNLIEWMHVVFNYLSFDDLYINTLFFNFLTLGGHVALFLVFYRRSQKDVLGALCAWLLPSVLFWTSCIHTEGLVYPLLGWLVYFTDKLLAEGWNTRRVLAVIFTGGLAIFLRPALAAGLIPALAAWIGMHRFPARRQQLFTGMTGIIGIGLVYLAWPTLFSRIFAIFSTRQAAFQSLTGGSRIALPLLEPTGNSLIHVFPTALYNGLFQPVPGSGGQAIYGLFSAELLFVWTLVATGLLARLFRKGSSVPPLTRSFTAFSLLLAVLGLLIIGYIVPFVGAIIRYRSIYLPFLLVPFLHQLQRYRIPAQLNIWLTRHIFKKSPYL